MSRTAAAGASLTLLRAAEGRRMPWRNGGGETIEIIAHPPAAGLDAFDWRVSLASLTADGPFSAFAGIDRTLVVVAGEGLALAPGGDAPVRLTTRSDPFPFAGETACTARLLSGPVTALNVMSRRCRARHVVRRIALPGPAEIAAQGVTLLVCCAGRIAVAGYVLDRFDVLVAHGSHALALVPDGAGAVVARITLLPS